MADMSSCEVAFFGSIVARLVEYEVKQESILANMMNAGTTLQLRLSATAAARGRARESFESSALTKPFALPVDAAQHGEARRCSHLPILVEAEEACAQWPTAEAREDGEPTRFLNDGDDDDDNAAKLHPLAMAAHVAVEMKQEDGTTMSIKEVGVMISNVELYAAKDLAAVLRIRLRPQDLNNNNNDDENDGDDDDDVAVVLFVVLRAVDLRERLCTTLDSDAAMLAFIGEHPHTSHLVMARRSVASVPYGSLPLAVLYAHYHLFCSRYYAKTLRQPLEAMELLTRADDVAEEEGFAGRWNTLREVALDRTVMGEEAFLPFLLALSHATNLCSLVVDRNGLGDLTCARMCVLLAKHRYLAALSMANNLVYEAGADQLLRLVRRNRRIVCVYAAGNNCSESILARLSRVTTLNAKAIDEDPLNLLSARYDYIMSPTSLSEDTLRGALGIWAMLTAQACGDIDVWVRNATTTSFDEYVDESVLPRMKAATEASAAAPSLIPPAAKAPLLSEMFRTVSVELRKVVPDPVVRSVFTDMESYARAAQEEDEAAATTTTTTTRSCASGSIDSTSAAKVRGFLPTNRANNAGVAMMAADELYQSSFLRIIVSAMRGIANGVAWREVAAVLRWVGVSQQKWRVEAEDYWLATHVLMRSLHVLCGKEEIAADDVAAFLQTMALALRTAVGSTVAL